MTQQREGLVTHYKSQNEQLLAAIASTDSETSQSIRTQIVKDLKHVLEQFRQLADTNRSEEVKHLQTQVKQLQARSTSLLKHKKLPLQKSDYLTPEEECPRALLFEEIEVLRAHVGESVEAHHRAAKLAEKEATLLQKERAVVASREAFLIETINRL